jgi:Spy/CpxP family protein refolding chaperone
MKKSSKIIVASLLLSCIAFTNVQAQDAISQPTTIGFKGGINF